MIFTKKIPHFRFKRNFFADALFIYILCLHLTIYGQAFKDSTGKFASKEPRHYFKSTFYFDYYTTPETNLVDKPKYGNWNKKLVSYQFKQSSGGFSIPIYTKDYKKSDTLPPANLHLLATGSYLLAKPIFLNLNPHNIFKGSLGLRGLYNSGKKNIFFVDLGVFAAQELKYSSPIILRTVTTLVYDRIVSEYFSFRLGYSKTFIFGNRLRLPYLGFRIGKLDRTNLSFQFPRNISVNFPIGTRMRASVFTKPMGGLYNFSNVDTIYFGNDSKFQFGRREFTSGIRVEICASRNFSFYLSTGIASKRNIEMSSFGFNPSKLFPLTPFYANRLNPSAFLNIGFTLRFGKTKKIYNNINIHEMLDLNSTIDPGDNNTTIGNGDIPAKPKIKSLAKIGLSEIQDLIETQDLY